MGRPEDIQPTDAYPGESYGGEHSDVGDCDETGDDSTPGQELDKLRMAKLANCAEKYGRLAASGML